MKFIFRIFVLLLVCRPIFAMPAQILLMRHAEKPEVGSELSAKGWQRAQLLPSLFLHRMEFQDYGLPVALYGMSPKKVDGSVRSIQTLKYLSNQFNIPIETGFTRDEISELMHHIKMDSNLDGKMIVICWQHDALVDIASQLGFKKLNHWPSKQFDRVWALNFSKTGKPVSFSDIPEKLLRSDSKK